MQKWRKKLKAFMKENGLSQEETIELVNQNGGEITQSGFSHWVGEKERSRPLAKNAGAIVKMTKGKITIKEIMYDD